MIIPLRQIRQRRAQRCNALILAQAMPSFASLLGVLVSSGQQPRQALTTFVESSPAGNLSALANDLGPVARALAVGADFAEAIDRLDATTPIGLSLYRVLDLLRRGEADGLDLALQLEFVVQDLRRDRSIASAKSAPTASARATGPRSFARSLRFPAGDDSTKVVSACLGCCPEETRTPSSDANEGMACVRVNALRR